MIMSIICTFFVFFLCLSMHACNARNLGVVDKVSSLDQFVVSDHKVQLKAESIQGRSGVNGEKIDHDMQVKAGTGATSQNKQKDTYIGGEIPGMENAGSETSMSCCHVDLLRARSTHVEGYSRRGLSSGVGNLGSNSNYYAKEGVDSKGYKGDEQDVKLTDYEPPYQTPPIHNKVSYLGGG